MVTGWKRLIVPRATDNGITFTLSAKWKAVRELFRRAPEIPDVRSRGTGWCSNTVSYEQRRTGSLLSH